MFLNLIIDCYQNSDCDADGYCIQGYCIKGDGRLSMNDLNVQLYVWKSGPQTKKDRSITF